MGLSSSPIGAGRSLSRSDRRKRHLSHIVPLMVGDPVKAKRLSDLLLVMAAPTSEPLGGGKINRGVRLAYFRGDSRAAPELRVARGAVGVRSTERDAPACVCRAFPGARPRDIRDDGSARTSTGAARAACDFLSWSRSRASSERRRASKSTDVHTRRIELHRDHRRFHRPCLPADHFPAVAGCCRRAETCDCHSLAGRRRLAMKSAKIDFE